MSASEDPAGNTPAEDTPLKRGISRNTLLFFIVGDMLGGGIYALVGEVGGEVGGAIWAAFLVAILLAALTAAAYAELSTKYPRAGGAALWVNRAFKTPIVSFLVTFVVMASGVTSASALARAFGGDYLSTFVDLPVVLVAIVLLVLVALINFRGIAESVKLNVAFTAIEVFGLLLIVVIGVAAVWVGTADPSRALEFREGGTVPLLILSGAALSFYALVGFEDSANVVEEVRDPSRSYPRALFGGLALAGVLYVVVSITAAAVVPIDRLAASDGPLLEVVKLGPLQVPETVFSAIALFAVTNSALINMIMASRILYGMSREGVLPSAFGRLNEQRRTPWVAIVFTTVLAFVLVSSGDLEGLADTTVALLLVSFILVNLSVLILKRDHVDHDHFRVPVFIPPLAIFVCLVLLTQQEASVFLRGGLIVALGLLLWFVNRLATRRAEGRDPASAA